MAKTIDWESRIGRRLRLRDLHVFFAVAQSGSMAKAAANLGVTQPSVSTAIRALEVVLNVRLFDRSTHGVETTIYGDALRKCGLAVFDDLQQGIKSIQFLSNPDTGEVRIGSSEALMAGCVPSIVDQFALQYPRVVLHTMEGDGSALRTALRERRIDLVIARHAPSRTEEDLASELLFHDEFLVVAGTESRWARRRKIGLAELLDEPWIIPVPDTLLGSLFREYFRSRGLTLPRVSVASNSMILRNRLLATGRYVSVLPRSILHFSGDPPGVKILPVRLPGINLVTEIVKLKDRTLSPTVELFIRHAREIAKTVARWPSRSYP